MFHARYKGKQIDYTNGHNCYSASLSDSIAAEAHDERKDGPSKQAHNHQS